MELVEVLKFRLSRLRNSNGEDRSETYGGFQTSVDVTIAALISLNPSS